MTKEELAARLKSACSAVGEAEGELAEIVGVRRETIARLEKAQYNPSLKLAVDISRAVGAPIEELFIFDS